MPRGPVSLKSVLQSGQQLKRLNQAISKRSQLLTQIRRALPSELSEHCSSANLEQDRLTIFADSPVWASRLRYATKVLADRLPCATLGIRRIRVGIQTQSPPPSPRRRPTPELSEDNRRLLRQVAEHLQDPELRRALQRLSNRGR